eukprot:TRINITY_DN5748_c0_g1_i1.p1 TRINITY_DN5748_c0_g1~~TRINITY_DN5748_c0_g1_i1.p1  ORF type:complete len:264 (-),score=21.65 TRINITY_DN5748_c0_g1_i1:107-898(-)
MSTTEPDQVCSITDFAGIIVQLILGVLCFSILICKRYIEHPRRHWKIWILDVSKQLASALVAHFANVVLSIVLTVDDEAGTDVCCWYFVSFMSDTTIGVVICYYMLKLTNKLLAKVGLHDYKTGNYIKPVIGDQAKRHEPFEISYKNWAIQLTIWNIIVVLSKFVLYFVLVLFAQALIAITNFLFQHLVTLPVIKLIVVMIIVPVIMNSLQFWIQDNFLKHKASANEDPQVTRLYFETDVTATGYILQGNAMQIANLSANKLL